MRLGNAFKHLVLCGINGCKMCRTVKIYNEYLGVIRQQHAATIVTIADLRNFVQRYSDFRDCDRLNNMLFEDIMLMKEQNRDKNGTS